MNEKEFVVVGGSSGIGLDIARLLTQLNQRVTVVSRSIPTMNEFKAVSHISLDIIRDEIDASSLPDRIQGLLYCPGSIALLSDDGKRAAAAERHPLKRIGAPSDIAAAARFLLDDSASWITGQIIAVDGGMGALRAFK